MYNADGMCGTVCMNDGDTHNQPIESGEFADHEALVLRYELRQDSGGPGKFRGGLGAEREILYFRDGLINGNTERSLCPPFGARGGKEGKGNAYSIATVKEPVPEAVLQTMAVLSIPRLLTEYPNASQPNLKLREKFVARGFIATSKAGGGGGYGSPLERDPEAVLDDVINGYVSLNSAETDYGVTIDTARKQVDEAKTKAQRARLFSQR